MLFVHLLQVCIPREQIYAIRENLPVCEAATEYAGQLLRLDEKVLPRNAEGKYDAQERDCEYVCSNVLPQYLLVHKSLHFTC